MYPRKPKQQPYKSYLDILEEKHMKKQDGIDDKDFKTLKKGFKAKRRKVGTFI
jgi:hypothetical protein